MKYTKQQLESMTIKELTRVRNELTRNSNTREEESTCPSPYEKVKFPNSFSPSIYTKHGKSGMLISMNNDGLLNRMCGFQFNLRGISFSRGDDYILRNWEDLTRSDIDNSSNPNYTIKLGLNGLVAGYNLSDEQDGEMIHPFDLPFERMQYDDSGNICIDNLFIFDCSGNKIPGVVGECIGDYVDTNIKQCECSTNADCPIDDYCGFPMMCEGRTPDGGDGCCCEVSWECTVIMCQVDAECECEDIGLKTCTAEELGVPGSDVKCLQPFEECVIPIPIPAEGDINEDGSVNVADIVQVIQLILNQQYEENADLNGDGSVNVADIVMMVNIILNPGGN